MQGIEQLTNIMTEGGRSDVPMNMGPQPMESAQGIAGMMPMQDMAMIQQGQAPSPADSAPQGIDINSDADMLASAVVGRTNGNLDEAEQVLEQSLMLIKTAKSQTQQPIMAAYGKPIMAAEGKPILAEGKERPDYKSFKEIPTPTKEQRRTLSQADFNRLFNLSQRAKSDMDKNIYPSEQLREEMRQLIMNDLAAKTRTVDLSDRDVIDLEYFGNDRIEVKPRAMSDQDLKLMRPTNKPGMAYGGEVEEYAGGGLIYLP